MDKMIVYALQIMQIIIDFETAHKITFTQDWSYDDELLKFVYEAVCKFEKQTSLNFRDFVENLLLEKENKN